MAKPMRAPEDMNSRTSASAEDLDDSMKGQNAAEAESARYDSQQSPSFGGGGRHQLQMDPSFKGYKKR